MQVDTVTGEVRARRMLGVFAAGRILNPRTARSQLTGGMVMGLGMALTEHSTMDAAHGDFAESDLASYHVPTHADVPADLQAHWIDEDDGLLNPMGSKGIGELGIVGAAAALGNAVRHATGIRFHELPLTPDRVLPALEAAARAPRAQGSAADLAQRGGPARTAGSGVRRRGPTGGGVPAAHVHNRGEIEQNYAHAGVSTPVAPTAFLPVLEQIAADIAATPGRGRPADYIPALAAVDPRRFGMAVAELDGTVYGVGDWRTPFSTQSITKAFTSPSPSPWRARPCGSIVGREPSGNPFNSLVQLEYENGICNPFINAGALVVTDRLQSLTGDAAGTLRAFLRAESGNPTWTLDRQVASSEAAHGDRNAALAYFMASYRNIANPVPDLLDQYFRQCSLEASCADLALAASFLARHGIRADGSSLLTRSQAKQVNAVMLTCGTYDAAGDFAYRVGLPGKSGVGGGIIAVVPGRCTLCVWSPGLDERGNSVAGVAALDRFTTLTGLSVF